MNIKELGLVGVLLSTGCAASNAATMRDNVRKETYTFEYDETPQELALALYMFQHDGQAPTDNGYASFYLWAPRDLNDNGVLDYRRVVEVSRRNGVVVQVDETLTSRTSSSDQGNEVSYTRLLRMDNGVWQKTVRTTGPYATDEQLEATFNQNYRDGKFQQEIDETGRALDQFWEQMHRQQNPSARPRNTL